MGIFNKFWYVLGESGDLRYAGATVIPSLISNGRNGPWRSVDNVITRGRSFFEKNDKNLSDSRFFFISIA